MDEHEHSTLSSDEAPIHPSWDEHNKQRRLQSLQDLAHQRIDTTRLVMSTSNALDAPLPKLSPTRRRMSVYVVLLTVVLILAIISSSIFVAIRHAQGTISGRDSHQELPAATISAALALGLRCTSQPSWSSDGRFIALLGTRDTGACVPYLNLDGSTAQGSNASEGAPPQTLAIFDAHTDKPVRSFDLDPLLGNKPNCNSSGLCGPDTARFDSFYGLTWSPDGQSIAVAYLNNLTPPGVPSLLVVRTDGSTSSILEDRAHAADAADLRIWDLQAHTSQATNIYSLQPFSMPFALTYQWDATGHLTPQSGTATSLDPIGNPDGGATFTPWQSGIVDPAYMTQTSLIVFQSSFWAWSPDSRYVATFLVVGGRLFADAMPLPTVDTTITTANLPAVAVRDNALAAVIQTAAQSSPATPAMVTWSPNGKDLASLSCTSFDRALLQVRSTRDSKIVATGTLSFPSSTSAGGCGKDIMPIQWSPDGTAVMTGNGAAATLTLWRVSQT